MICVILLRPENPGNVGAICRAMKNFSLNKLVIISPKYAVGKNAIVHRDAIRRAKHAGDILRKAVIADMKFLNNLDLVVGTTAKLGTDYNISRTPVRVGDAVKMIVAADSAKNKVGIVFGPEGEGLSNEEIKKCDYVVTIPTSQKYRAMNISQAAAILFYEIFRACPVNGINGEGYETVLEQFVPASKKEKEVLLNYVNSILDNIHFSTSDKKETQRVLWKRIIGKSNLSKREAFALCGFFRKLHPQDSGKLKL